MTALFGSGVEFAESITNLDYGSSETMQASFPDSQMQAFSAGCDTAFKSDLCRLMDVPNCPNDQVNIDSPESSDIPRSCTSQNIGKFHNSSSCSSQDILSGENDGRLSPAGEISCSSKTEKGNEFEPTGENGDEALATMPVQASYVLPTQKRARKPTRRYIDEVANPISTYSKKRRDISSPTLKDKSLGVKDHKKCLMRSRAVKISDEKFSLKAIQVPFASLGHKECSNGHAYDMVLCEDSRNLMTKLKGKRVSPENQKKRDECITAAITLKKKDDSPTSQKKRDDCVIASRLNKRHGFTTAASQKKRNKCTVVVSQNKRDDCLTAEITEEVSVRRKHHIVWTIAEVRKLIDGVSQYGVGRWSRIKKLFFSTSAHRTSVDLKGEKKRNVAWRPLPKSILRRVCELATMYPYPKGQRLKIAHINHDSPDRNTDITLNDYRSILRSINGN
ncbi:hypothetical protein DH2020_015027 [Rehmannia glutinosa]|uniref:Telomere repeat-binding factor like-protein n=1 Tax=Rehmannia glutinosa TaxID=99300 RepID=A0ABR0WY75_REHGL